MKFSTFVAALTCTLPAICTASVYYQPNGVFIPVALSIPAVVDQGGQSGKQVVQHQQQQAVAAGTSATVTSQSTPANNSSNSWPFQLLTLWNNIFGPESGIASLLGLSKSQKLPAVAASNSQINQTTALLTELLTLLKPAALNFLDGLKMTLENANLRGVANILSKPVDDLRNFLMDVLPETTLGPVDTRPRPLPATASSKQLISHYPTAPEQKKSAPKH
ncbi:hypothetical protein H4217_005098 [Coemansia sp. RSA 1939]|nr:hypothetical protein H4217_005098 [Coemansia sp. RSA 1939]